MSRKLFINGELREVGYFERVGNQIPQSQFDRDFFTILAAAVIGAPFAAVVAAIFVVGVIVGQLF
jgi:hypothetical protein